MSRYYTVALGTPSKYVQSYSNEYLYGNASPGFLFYDAVEEITVNEVRRALFTLRDLFEGAKEAFVISVSPDRMFATFSMNSFPVPASRAASRFHSSTGKTTEYLQTAAPMAWLIQDVTDVKTPPQEAPLADLYDGCKELFRLMGNCPCEKALTGACLTENVIPKYPWLEEARYNEYLLDHTLLTRKAYNVVNGFQYVSSKKTTEDDFAKTFRPWDNHNFGFVPARSVSLSARAKLKHSRAQYRRTTCAGCAFSTKHAQGVDDCGAIHSCSGAVTESEAWIVLYKWYQDSKFEVMPGFTSDERDYLLLKMGEVVKTRALNTPVNISCTLGGFVRDSQHDWYYRISAAKGRLQRHRDFRNYSELKAAIPSLPEVPATAVTEPPNARIKLACAILGARGNRHVHGKGYAPIHSLAIRGTSIGVRTVNSRYTIDWEYLDSQEDSVKKFYSALQGMYFGDAARLLKEV